MLLFWLMCLALNGYFAYINRKSPVMMVSLMVCAFCVYEAITCLQK